MFEKVNEYELSHKVVLHIPLDKRVDGKVVSNSMKAEAFISLLIVELDGIGYKSLYIVDSDGVYDGLIFKQKLVTVYSYSYSEMSKLARTFKSLVKRYNANLCQSSYCYEYDGVMMVFKISDI